MRRVVVTGMGVLSPIGNDVSSSIEALTQGRSGIASIKAWTELSYPSGALPVTIGGEVKNFDPEKFIEPKKDIRRMDRFIHLAMAAAHEAWRSAGLPDHLSDEEGNRAGAIIGVGLIGVQVFLEQYDILKERGPRRVSPFFIPATIANLAPGNVAIRYNLRGPSWSPVSACASGTHGVGEAMMNIRDGRADIMVAGGTESAMHPLAVSGFNSMHALCSSKNNSPTEASRPFDRERDGFVMGEGAGVLVLEELEHAKKRGANILAEITGYGSTSDAFHITAPAEKGEGAQRAIGQAIEMSHINPEEIGYINAHGTSTLFNDKSETDAIKEVFGDHAKKLMISSTKSMTGHLLGAAGGVESVFTVATLMKGFIPPTINLHNPDPDCDLDYVPNSARQKQVNFAMSNSFGFGGTNAVVIFKRWR